jgi:hypothetical protein
VTFRWQPNDALPLGTAYEAVSWSAGEDPAAARGLAATTAQSELTIDLDALYGFGQLKSGNLYWTVLIVRTAPYSRLTKPTADNGRLLTYQPPADSGGPGASTPVPPPR